MPAPVPTTRLAPDARPLGAARHCTLSYAPVPRIAGVIVRLVALMAATAFAIGAATAVTLTVLTGLVTQLGH
jgi:hypothetical protein